jgi:heme A synthase
MLCGSFTASAFLYYPNYYNGAGYEMKLTIVIALALALLALVRRGQLQVDLSFPLFMSLILLGFASMSDGFIHWSAAVLGIIDPPVAIIFMAIAILLGLVTILAIAYSQLHHRQLMLLRYLAETELRGQEQVLRNRS